MSSATFKTNAEAAAAGWVSPRGVHERYRGFNIEGRDVSGPNSRGERFALTANPAKIPFEIYGVMAVWEKRFAESHTLWLTEGLNQLGQPGSVTLKFHPQEFKNGVAAAKDAIDAFYESCEAAREWETAEDLRRAESEAKARQRHLARALKLQAKYGDELSVEWKKVLEAAR